MGKGWPPLEKCIQFQNGMIRGYLQKFDCEDEEGDEEREYLQYSSDEDSPPQKIPYKPSSINKFLHVVRTTRGYDIDQVLPVPEFMRCRFSVYSEEQISELEVYLNAAVDLAIKEINSKTGNAYKHAKTLKVIGSPHRVLLITFTATAKFTEKNKKTGKKKKVEREHIFLAAVYTPAPKPHLFKVLECFRKPKDPAPWTYMELECDECESM